MSGHNPFLKDFIEMRKAMSHKQETSQMPASSASHALPKKTPKKKKAEMKSEQEVKDASLMTIIEDKPHRRVVIEWLQNRANEYTIEKMK